jgi:hypothetical protein
MLIMLFMLIAPLAVLFQFEAAASSSDKAKSTIPKFEQTQQPSSPTASASSNTTDYATARHTLTVRSSEQSRANNGKNSNLKRRRNRNPSDTAQKLVLKNLAEHLEKRAAKLKRSRQFCTLLLHSKIISAIDASFPLLPVKT